MEHKDYLEREIEKITLMLMRILDKVLHFHTLDETEVESIQSEFQSEINFEAIINGAPDELELILQGSKFTEDQIETLADILMNIGIKLPPVNEKRILYLSKALHLYNIINAKSSIYSLTRQKNIESINLFLIN